MHGNLFIMPVILCTSGRAEVDTKSKCFNDVHKVTINHNQEAVYVPMIDDVTQNSIHVLKYFIHNPDTIKVW